jgi:hypothetical protein
MRKEKKVRENEKREQNEKENKMRNTVDLRG